MTIKHGHPASSAQTPHVPIKKVALLGLGAMGSRMARRLLGAGFELSVWNRSPSEVTSQLADAGARVANSPRDAAQGQQLVIAMLRDDDASREVWLNGQQGALAGMEAGSIALESSTLTPQWIRELEERTAAQKVQLVEAPVLGSRPQAEAGQLIYLLGGSSESGEKLMPVLNKLGSAFHQVGKVGDAATLKLAINTFFATQVVAMGEFACFTKKLGLDAAQSLTLLSELPVCSPAMKGIASLCLTDKHDPLFPVDLVAKDLDYLLQSFDPQRDELELAGRVLHRFQNLRKNGLGNRNISVAARLEANR